MAYSTQAQMESAITAERVVDLCDEEGSGSGNTPIAVRVTEAIRKADGEIDGYSQARYSVPVDAPVGSMTNVLSIHLAIYYLYLRRFGAFGLPDAVKDSYDKRISQLEKINKGVLDPGVSPTPAKSAKIAADSDGPTRLFTSKTATSNGTMGEF